jgi:hypothetical protein
MLDTAVPVLALQVPLIGFSVTRRLRAVSTSAGQELLRLAMRS